MVFGDGKGMIWPLNIAPFHVHVTPMKYQDPAVKEAVDQVCAALEDKGVEYLLDDRNASPGVKFADADAIGVPYRITFGRGLAKGEVELTRRRDGEARDLPLDAVGDEMARIVAEEIDVPVSL